MDIPLHAVDSRSVAQIGYDEATRILAIEFPGGTLYHYPGVSPETYAAFARSPSKSGYFETAIRDHYKTVKISPHKTFTGFGSSSGRVVTVVTTYKSGPTTSEQLARGSKDATFDWGNADEGALSLATALLAATIGRKRASALAPALRDRVIAQLPIETWTLTETAIREEVDAIEEATA
jgi:hypothetical protein